VSQGQMTGEQHPAEVGVTAYLEERVPTRPGRKTRS
jgi:hypothetical protein